MPTTALHVISGPGAERMLALGGEMVFGREQTPGGISFTDDAALSRAHARFRRLDSGGVLLEDLGSRNGTWVNDQRITVPRLLQVGDKVRVGHTVIRLETVATTDTVASPVPHDEASPTDLPTQGSETVRTPRSSRPFRASPVSPAEPSAPPPLAGPPTPGGPSLAAAPLTPAGSSSPGQSTTSDVARVNPPLAPPWLRTPEIIGAPARRTARRRMVIALAVLMVVAAGFGGGVWVGDHRKATTTGATGDPDPRVVGTVYVERGSAGQGSNTVIAYQYRAGGNLQPLRVAEYPTDGSGGFDLTNTGALDADHQIVVSDDNRLLFAVNQGSDTVAVFHIQADGGLVPVKGSPFPSGGAAPGGLAITGHTLVVVNKAHDGVRDLRAVPPNFATFIVEPSGVLRPTGSTIPAPPGSSPTEALVSPDGKIVVAPEEHGPLRSMRLGPGGKLAEAPGSPFALPESIFPPGFPAANKWALGLATLRTQQILYAQVVNTGQMVVYRYDDLGQLSFVRSVDDPGAFLPCWSLINPAGTRLYTDNAGNNTMSVFDISDPLNPRQIQVLTLKNAGNPWDLTMDPTGRFIFVLDPRDRQDLVGPGDGNELHTVAVNDDGTLTEPAYSPVPIPVPLNTNPIGVVVVPRR